MALQAPQLDGITQISELCKKVLEIEGQIDRLDILFNGDTNWAALVTQLALDDVALFKASGLTVANVNDALFILKTSRTNWLTNLPALVAMASLR